MQSYNPSSVWKNNRLFFHTEEGLYTRNVCVNRQFWHFAIIISLIINLIFIHEYT